MASGGSNIKTNETFIQEVYDLVRDEYRVIGCYKTAFTKIDMLHVECGRIWNVVPNSFLNGRRCGLCFGSHKRTQSQFVQDAYMLVGSDYKVIGGYVNSSTKLDMLHIGCGTTWGITPSSFLTGRRCPSCFGTPKKTHAQFVKQAYDKQGDEYTVMGRYRTTMTKIKMLHNVCGKSWMITPSDFLSGYGCPTCGYKKIGDSLRRTHDEFVNMVYGLVGNEYQVMGEYKGGTQKLDMLHVECGNTWSVTPSSFLHNGRRCPSCSSSKGESTVQQFLEHYNIKFTPQAKFDECKNNRHLPFDFWLPDFNTLIEYNGRQHYVPVSHFGGEEQLKVQRKHDRIKRRFCRKYDINLIEIPYTKFENIETILTEALF